MMNTEKNLVDAQGAAALAYEIALVCGSRADADAAAGVYSSASAALIAYRRVDAGIERVARGGYASFRDQSIALLETDMPDHESF